MLSVVIITKNEALNIRRCLESVRWADEVIVLDSGSQDQTVAIAQEYTDKVFVTQDWRGYGVQKQRALSYATGDWVLNLDADESVGEDLKEEILRVTQSDFADAFRIPIRMYFYGKRLRYSSSPKRHVRLFKREGAHYSDDIVHEKIILPVGSRIEKLKIPIMHQSYRDLTHALAKVNLYSSYSAKMRIREGKPPGFMKTLFSAGWMFYRCYVLQLGFLDGKEGFVCALLNAQGSMYRGLKQLYPDRGVRQTKKVEHEETE